MIYLLLIILSAGCLSLGLAILGLAVLNLNRIVRDHTNQLLGLQYDVGQLAIALDDAGISISDGLREAAYLYRPDAGQD